MSQKEYDGREDLLQKLRETLASVSDESDAPQDLFREQTQPKDEQASSTELEEFNSYMAELLGEALDDRGRSSRRKGTGRRAAKRAEPDARAEEREEEQTEAMEPVEEAEHTVEAQPSAYREEEQDRLADETLPQPDARAELPGEVFEDYGDESEEETDAPVGSEREADALSPPFEVVEQLTILDTLPTPTENEPTGGGEIDASPAPADITADAAVAVQAEDAAPAETEVVDGQIALAEETDEPAPADATKATEPEEQSVEDDMREDEPSPALEDAPEIEPTQEDESEGDMPMTEDGTAPLVLEKGDLVLDAEDELPPVPEAEAVPAADGEKDKTEPTPARVDEHPSTAAPAPTVEEPPRPKQSPLDALAAQRQGNAHPVGGGASPFTSRAPKERTLTDDDVELLLDLGYDNHLMQKVGAQRIEAVRYRRQDDEKSRRKLRHAYGCTGEEYVSHTQDKGIRATYRAQYKGATVRLMLAVVLTVLAFFTDLLPIVRESLPEGVLSAIPFTSAYGVFGLVLLLLTAIVCLPYLKRGAAALMRFTIVPASMPLLLLIVGIVYQTVGLFDEVLGLMLCFPTVLMLLLLSIGERMNIRREALTFDIVSARSRKIVMVAQAPRKKKVVRGGHIVKIINDDAGKRTWRVRPTDQVAGYFRRSAKSTPRYRTLAAMLLVAVAAALVVSILTLIVTEQLRAAFSAFLLTLQTSIPAAALISYAYPTLLASRKLAAEGCAIVGQSAVDEYAGEKLLLFDDTEMFRSKSSTEITIKGSGDTKKYIRYAKRLFRTLGGTLRGVSTSDLSEETWEERVEILKIFEQGVEARIDGKVHILVGTSAFMISQGIRVPGESAELLVRRNVESCILYLAFDGKLRLGYEVDHRISSRFEQTVAELAQAGTSVAIETCDPSLHEAFLTRSRRVGSVPVAVVKPTRFERQTDSLLCDSGIVATRSARDAARATFMCDRLMENDAHLARFHHVSTVFGAVVSLALSLLGLAGMMAGFIAALLQVLWCLPVVMLSNRRLNNEQDPEKQHADRKE